MASREAGPEPAPQAGAEPAPQAGPEPASEAGPEPAPESGSPRACDRCLARTWLIGRLAGHIDLVRGRVEEVLELGDAELIAAVGGGEESRVLEELEALDVASARARSDAAGLETICVCDPRYPPALRALGAPPAVLHVAGGLERLLELVGQDPVALVGSRQASMYGMEMAGALGRGLAFAGITVVSGMALGIDSAVHAGALEVGAPTVAVLPGSAHRPYPASKRVLHRRIVAAGAAVSELGPGTSVRRWMFLARNRIIAGLAAMTVVIEAGEHSGSLVAARAAAGLGRPVGAVPGRVTTPQSAGPHELLANGACLVRGAQDVLDHLFGAGVRIADGADRGEPPSELRPLLAAIGEGHDTGVAVARVGLSPAEGLAALAALELEGFLRRGLGGRFEVTP
jgi:DNA processing protein